MRVIGPHAGYKAMARCVLALAVKDAKSGYLDYEGPEEDPRVFMTSSWFEDLCSLGNLAPAMVSSMIRETDQGKAPIKRIYLEISPASRRFTNVVGSHRTAASIIGCEPIDVWRAITSGKGSVNGWSVRMVNGGHNGRS